VSLVVQRVVAETTSLGLVVLAGSVGRFNASVGRAESVHVARATNASVALEVARVLVAVRSASSSTNSSTRAAKPTVLVRLAKASRLLVAGAARAAGDRTAALLVTKTVTVLASRSSTSGKALSVTVNALTLTTTVGLVLTVVIAVAMKMHAPVTLELLLLELSSIGFRAVLKLGKLLGSLLGKITALVGELL
jgi:hypothetical protein